MTSECFIFANGQRIGPMDLAQIKALAPTLPPDAQVWIPPGGWRPASALAHQAPITAPPPTTPPVSGIAHPEVLPATPTPHKAHVNTSPQRERSGNGKKIALGAGAGILVLFVIGAMIAGGRTESGTSANSSGTPTSAPAPAETAEQPTSEVAETMSIEEISANSWDGVSADTQQMLCDMWDNDTALLGVMWKEQVWPTIAEHGYDQKEAWYAFADILIAQC